MKVVVLSFPGSNCDDDAVHVCGRVLGRVLKAEARYAWHKDPSLGA